MADRLQNMYAMLQSQNQAQQQWIGILGNVWGQMIQDRRFKRQEAREEQSYKRSLFKDNMTMLTRLMSFEEDPEVRRGYLDQIQTRIESDPDLDEDTKFVWNKMAQSVHDKRAVYYDGKFVSPDERDRLEEQKERNKVEVVSEYTIPTAY